MVFDAEERPGISKYPLRVDRPFLANYYPGEP